MRTSKQVLCPERGMDIRTITKWSDVEQFHPRAGVVETAVNRRGGNTLAFVSMNRETTATTYVV